MALHSPASKAGRIGVSSHAFFPSRDHDLAQMQEHQSVQVASKVQTPARSVGDTTILTLYDLRKGSVVTVELPTIVYVA